MGKFEGADVWADNADDGAGLRRREERAAAREAEFASFGIANYTVGKKEIFSVDPAEATPKQIAVAEKFIGGIEMELAPDVEITKPDMHDTDPAAATPEQLMTAESILKSRESDIKLTPITTENDPYHKVGSNFIPAIKTTKTPEVKPWSKPAPEKSFFKRLFGG